MPSGSRASHWPMDLGWWRRFRVVNRIRLRRNCRSFFLLQAATAESTWILFLLRGTLGVDDRLLLPCPSFPYPSVHSFPYADPWFLKQVRLDVATSSPLALRDRVGSRPGNRNSRVLTSGCGSGHVLETP